MTQRLVSMMLPLAVLAASTALATVPGFQEPVGPWKVDYAEHQCVASRSYGPSKDPLHFLLKPSPSSDVVQIALVKDGGKVARGVQVEASIVVGEAAAIKSKQLSYGNGGKDVRLINLNQANAAALAKADRINWDASGPPVLLRLGDMAPVMKALADCRTDLAKFWNVGPEFSAGLKSPPKERQSIYGLFSDTDYPSKAIIDEGSGTTKYILLIDEKGALRDCMVVETSGVAVLDAQTCLVIRTRARFDPAIGMDGKPVRGSINGRIRWELGN